MKKQQLSSKLILWCFRLKITNDQNFTIPNSESREVYYFENYNSFLEYFQKYGIDISLYEETLKDAIFLRNKHNEIYATKYLCDYIINKIKQPNNKTKSLTKAN